LQTCQADQRFACCVRSLLPRVMCAHTWTETGGARRRIRR
jgi:hypothetical protein